MGVIVDITGLNKEDVLRVLYNAAKPLNNLLAITMGREVMMPYTAKNIIRSKGNYLYFDYIYMRPMKIDITTNSVDTSLYNRDNGANAAENAVNQLRVIKPESI